MTTILPFCSGVQTKFLTEYHSLYQRCLTGLQFSIEFLCNSTTKIMEASTYLCIWSSSIIKKTIWPYIPLMWSLFLEHVMINSASKPYLCSHSLNSREEKKFIGERVSAKYKYFLCVKHLTTSLELCFPLSMLQ
jgi:hypothetical protein